VRQTSEGRASGTGKGAEGMEVNPVDASYNPSQKELVALVVDLCVGIFHSTTKLIVKIVRKIVELVNAVLDERK
jgi:hypothetical protein